MRADADRRQSGSDSFQTLSCWPPNELGSTLVVKTHCPESDQARTCGGLAVIGRPSRQARSVRRRRKDTTDLFRAILGAAARESSTARVAAVGCGALTRAA